MGYYTDYELYVSAYQDGKQLGYQSIPALVAKDLEKEIDMMNVFERGDCSTGWYANAKWYEHEDDMILLSKRFPELLFELSGTGEGNDDIWTSYFHDGASQLCVAEIVYPPFDPSKMVKHSLNSDQKYSYQD